MDPLLAAPVPISMRVSTRADCGHQLSPKWVCAGDSRVQMTEHFAYLATDYTRADLALLEGEASRSRPVEPRELGAFRAQLTD